MFDYKLKFDTEQQADSVLEPILKNLHPSQYVRYNIGQILAYERDSNNPDGEPITTIVDSNWYVDLRLREDTNALDSYRVYPKTQIHSFS